ncbi:hypothetical protein [Francisella sp. SYW-9]|uniref:hypothetical protein n=1 Tax=Francisella sp. SYW-9 TaxID=2610888 RepID=UPI00123C7E5F|nr:hypothetical protein [Francisella sp. SYW-9]
MHRQHLLKNVLLDKKGVCGIKDELICGARILHRKLKELGISHEYQEFDDDHFGIDYQNYASLPYLYKSFFPDF